MKKYLITIVFLLLVSLQAISQQYLAPKGFLLFKDFDKKEFKIFQDFDGDKIKDLAAIYAKKGSEDANIVVVHLSLEKKQVSFLFNAFGYDFEFDKNVLTVGACLGTGRYCESYKFRYDATLKSMRLIGYEEESFGNAAHDGAYLKSVNFLSGKFEISGEGIKGKKVEKISISTIKLEDLNKPATTSILEKIGEKYLN